MTIFAIVLSGGVGTRFGGEVPKQYIKVNGKTILAATLRTLFLLKSEYACQAAKEDVNLQVIVVADQSYRSLIEGELSSADVLEFADSGETRQLSIYQGLCRAKELGAKEEDLVVIQDAARPGTSLKLYEGLIAPLLHGECEGVLPTLPMKDTVYLSEDGTSITGLLERSTVVAGQAPEAFVFGKYLQANEALLPEKIKAVNGSTEVAILAGMNVHLIAGEENNFKITTREDLYRYEGLCARSGE